MDPSTQPPQPGIGIVGSAEQIAYSASTYPPAGMVAEAPTIIGAPSSTSHPTSALPINSMEQSSPYQLAFQQVQQFHHQQQQHQQQQQQLQAFWANQMSEIEQTTDFKNHSLPLARIKKIMKADEEVRMISAEAPVIFAKACEILVLELTLRAWLHTEENKRRTLQKNDIAAAISKSDTFDFLVDIVPREELKDEVLGTARAALPTVGAAADSVPYYYVPAPGQVPGPGMIMGNLGDQTGVAAIYAPQLPHQVAYMWQQPDHAPNTN